MKQFLSIILVFLAVITVSCKKNESDTTSSSVAQLTSFYFAPNDTFPGLGEAKFTVKELVDTGLVYNEDSIRFGTELKRVVPKFRFAATPSSAVLYLGKEDGSLESVMLTGSDTLDFTRTPIYLTLKSQDETKTKTYAIRATVHSADPDLFVWERLVESVCTDDAEQQTLPLNGGFVMLTNKGGNTHAYTSANGADWEDKGECTGLMTGCHVRQIISDGTTLYYTEAGNLYRSTDGFTWSSSSTGISGTAHTMLMAFNEKVWAVVEDATGQLYMDSLNSSGTLSETQIKLDKRFPIGNFASVCFPSASGRAHALVLGGYSREGESLNSRWAFEYSAAEDTIRIKNMTIEQPNFTCLTGASMVWYNHELYLFGGINDDAQLQSQPMLISRDEGMNWTMPDTTKCKLPDAYSIRQKQSAIAQGSYIYLFAGESRTQTFNDVYRGKLNSIDWQ